jgi:hypothetical protein
MSKPKGPKTSDDINREYLEELKAQIEREDKTPVCIDCKTWESTPDVIVLCPAHAAFQETFDALKWALEVLEDEALEQRPNANGWDAAAFKLGLDEMRAAIARAKGKKTETR